MLVALAVILAISWLLVFAIFEASSGFVHLLLVLAIVSLVLHFVQLGYFATHRAER